jgi:hypothetical protein
MKTLVAVVVMAAMLGCTAPTFTDLGNGVGVPVESIDEYARSRGVSRAQARAQMRAESDAERLRKHAEKYGVSVEEARRQLEHAGSVDSDQ